MPDLNQAREFMNRYARLLDRRRLDLLVGQGDPEATISTLAGYANDDGGFGWALHPDLRSATSQPVGATHAFEVLDEARAGTSPMAVSVCDWLDRVSLTDGGLPFALPHSDQAGSAPMWAGADGSRSSLLITCAVCAIAHRIADRYPAVAEHRWLSCATDYCLGEIAEMDRPRMAIETGLALLRVAIDAILAPTLTPRLVERFGTVRVIATGMALGVAGYALFLPVGTGSAYVATLLPTMILVGLAFTLVYGPLTIAATDGVADAEQGLAGGLFNTSFQFGAALGLAVVAAVVVAATGTADDPQALLDGYRAGLVVPVAGAALALAVTLPGLRAPRAVTAERAVAGGSTGACARAS